jgi:hypothetical protein
VPGGAISNGGRSEDLDGKWDKDDVVVAVVEEDGGNIDNEAGPASLPVPAM